MKMKNPLPGLAFLIMLLFLFSCQKDVDYKSESFSNTIDSRITKMYQKIPVVSNDGLKTLSTDQIGYEFVLIAEVESPTVNNELLQATHVNLVNNLAFVSYNMIGTETIGAVDIIDIIDPFNPVLINSIAFEDKDINTIGWYNDNYIIAGQDANGAFYSFNNIFNSLPSYSAISMDINNDIIYIVTGDNGGLVTISEDGENFIPIDDARSVVVGNEVYVLSSNGIYIIDGEMVPIDNNYLQTHSKADIDISDEYLFAALNRGGVNIYDINDMTLLQNLSRPITPNGKDPENYVTNSVSYNYLKSLLFIADGGAGIRVSGKYDYFDKNNELFLEYGYFDFGSSVSSNFVLSEGNFVFVASGLGGLKILTIVEIDQNPDDPCIWEEETAFGGSVQGNGSAWWYYFDNTIEASQPIYAGQNLIDGAYVTYENGIMTIELGDNMMLQDVSEPVKIQGYEEGQLPTKRPSAGLFTTYKGDELVIELPNYPYYVIHLDVLVCTSGEK